MEQYLLIDQERYFAADLVRSINFGKGPEYSEKITRTGRSILKSELEFLDGDNTSIYFKYSNGFYYHISMEVYPRGKNGVFSEIKNILENL